MNVKVSQRRREKLIVVETRGEVDETCVTVYELHDVWERVCDTVGDANGHGTERGCE